MYRATASSMLDRESVLKALVPSTATRTPPASCVHDLRHERDALRAAPSADPELAGRLKELRDARFVGGLLAEHAAKEAT